MKSGNPANNLKQLKHAKVPCKSLATFYTSCIRSVIDHAIPVFYHALPQYLQNDLKRLEKRAMAIIMPTESNSSTLNILGIPPLKDHHEQLCAKLFQSVCLIKGKKPFYLCNV